MQNELRTIYYFKIFIYIYFVIFIFLLISENLIYTFCNNFHSTTETALYNGLTNGRVWCHYCNTTTVIGPHLWTLLDLQGVTLSFKHLTKATHALLFQFYFHFLQISSEI